MYIIGLTGMSGAGKGYVSSKLSIYGYTVLDADLIYKKLTNVYGPCNRDIAEHFGADILRADGSLDRKKLGEIVFNSPGELQALNRITHVHVLSEIRLKIHEEERLREKAVIIDAPQLFESGLDRECNFIIGVVARKEICVQRITERDGISEVSAMLRLENQLNEEFFRSHCDIIIENNGENIIPVIETTVKTIKENINEKA